jgi:large conductance mechanosensitive channel
MIKKYLPLIISKTLIPFLLTFGNMNSIFTKNKIMKIIKDFKAFAMKSNVLDLAVGIIIGAAFGKIVASLVSDVIMPPIGVLVGGINFTDIKITIKDAVMDPANGKILKEAVVLKIGNFIQSLVDFIIIAFSIFMLITGVSKVNKKTPTAPTPPTKQEELLVEIRDLLKNNNTNQLP